MAQEKESVLEHESPKEDTVEGVSDSNQDDEVAEVNEDWQDERHLQETELDLVGKSMSTSKLQFETVNGSYHFSITGLSHAKRRGVGKHISRGTFTVGGHDWAIYFYPDGKHREENKRPTYVSVFVTLVSESSHVQAIFELVMLDRSGRRKHKICSHFDGRSRGHLPCTLKSKGSMWGFKHFYRRAQLEESGYLKDDTIEFSGKVGVLLSSVRATKLCTIPDSTHSAQRILGQVTDSDSHGRLQSECPGLHEKFEVIVTQTCIIRLHSISSLKQELSLFRRNSGLKFCSFRMQGSGLITIE